MLCREIHLVNSLQPTNFLTGQTAKQLYNKNTRKIILLHQPRATGKFIEIAQVKAR